MVELGFHDIAKPGMLQTVGRFMTLSKGIALKKVSMETVEQTFMQLSHGKERIFARTNVGGPPTA
jgi:hypothetical protein